MKPNGKTKAIGPLAALNAEVENAIGQINKMASGGQRKYAVPARIIAPLIKALEAAGWTVEADFGTSTLVITTDAEEAANARLEPVEEPEPATTAETAQ